MLRRISTNSLFPNKHTHTWVPSEGWFAAAGRGRDNYRKKNEEEEKLNFDYTTSIYNI